MTKVTQSIETMTHNLEQLEDDVYALIDGQPVILVLAVLSGVLADMLKQMLSESVGVPPPPCAVALQPLLEQNCQAACNSLVHGASSTESVN